MSTFRYIRPTFVGAQLLFACLVLNITAHATTKGGSGPAILTQPANLAVAAGQAANFSVMASGRGRLRYQWMKNGANITGATAASYTTPATAAADSGSQFSVIVSDSNGDVTSNAATLTVNSSAPSLNASPTSLSFGSVNVTSSSTFPVVFTNAGASSITISNVSSSGPGFRVNGLYSGQIVGPGQTGTLNVTFSPASGGNVTGSAVVTSNAANSPTTVSLSGSGNVPVSHTVSLTWNSSSSSNVVGYNIYRGSASGGPYASLTSTPVASPGYTDNSVLSAHNYFYVVTAVVSAGAESVYSNEASAVIP